MLSAQQVTIIAPVTFAMLETPVLGCRYPLLYLLPDEYTQDAANPNIPYCQLNAKKAANSSVPFCQLNIQNAANLCILCLTAEYTGCCNSFGSAD